MMAAELTARQRAMLDTWHKHAHAEFVLRDADETISTMTDDAYILGIPIGQMTVGRAAVHEFYRTQFLCNIPDECTMEQVNTIVAEDHILEEFVLSFLHDREMPWHLPGIAPTFKRCKCILMVLVGFRGDKIAYEHLMWDHAGCLQQLGIIDHPAVRASLPSNDRILDLKGDYQPLA